MTAIRTGKKFTVELDEDEFVLVKKSLVYAGLTMERVQRSEAEQFFDLAAGFISQQKRHKAGALAAAN